MTDPPAIPDSEPAILSYQAVPAPFHHPRIATIGFLLFGISFIGPIIWLSLSAFDPGNRYSLVQFLFILLNGCSFSGALLIAHAFRRSPLVSRRFQVAMFSIAATAAALISATDFMIFYGIPTLVDPAHLTAIAFNSTTVGFLENIGVSLYVALLLILLLRVGRSIHSRSFQVASAAILGMQAFLWACYGVLDLLMAANVFNTLDSTLCSTCCGCLETSRNFRAC